MNPASLSKRGRTAATSPLRADFELFEAVMQNHYHPEDNPTGAIPLCIAENILGWAPLRDKFREIVAAKTTPDWVASYTSTLGHPEFRAALAQFLSKHLGGDSLNPETMAIMAGATATIEMTAFMLGDPGDVAVIPAPAYTVYTGDIGNRAGMERYDLHLADSEEHPGLFNLRTQDLDASYAELGERFKLLILTQPNNPTGQVFTEDQIFDAVTWCEERQIHCVVNELYALSLIDQSHPVIADDYGDRQWFVSCLSQLEQRRSDYFHWWYSFSKDFGVSGLRIGAMYTKNEALIKAWANYSAPGTSSNYVQWLLTELLNDGDWAINWIREENRLTESYVEVIKTLRALAIPYTPAVGSLFVWFDLSGRLTADTDEAWVALWEEVYDRTGLLLTHPLGMGARKRGWMRLVFSGVPRATIRVAMRRFSEYWRSAD
ncbi:aminotransferase class I/II-fold pyridoxal phosphate-dependent enzyme [Neolewinella antarctica]|uniref:Aminotransferase n=1 Tax=Neolewinella antarctica TaxID=442734 RepID=A0ABX0X924_9BACT|nr:aminotransferase class I/II-fold pyridoxal phosphate-dependent enzyme [Neolewinella antarctica]NJC25459.1 aspartate/methionine/tyrosine aminotransferase [Neolewinella antarctica]